MPPRASGIWHVGIGRGLHEGHTPLIARAPKPVIRNLAAQRMAASDLLQNPQTLLILDLSMRKTRTTNQLAKACSHLLPPTQLLQFEDFQTEKAFEILHRQRDKLLCFNDDIQASQPAGQRAAGSLFFWQRGSSLAASDGEAAAGVP